MIPGWLTGRWAVGALACGAFGLLVWFFGDTLALGDGRPLEAPGARFALLAAAIAGWLGWEIWRATSARREAARLLEAITGAGLPADSAERAAGELATLQARFEEAAALLRRARFRGEDGERRYVHQLPWYIFIGAPGSGKTTALVNCGLQFPLGARHGDPAVQGVGGTRNCDWWFTDRAVLLDTAGRYTTQESDRQADAAAWLGFLDLLKRYRPRQPLNGAIVTLSIADLVTWSEEERARYAGHVRTRLAELYARLGVRFPVYLMLTKADLLAGFMDYFGELDAEARARVWGATFEPPPASAQAPAERFAAELEDLERRLYGGLVDRLQQEPDLQRRAAIYRFPQQFHGLGPMIAEFLGRAFPARQDGPLAMLRGVYFTSGTQEGSPIDRVLGALARSFNLERSALPAAAGAGKSFFLRRLVREVILSETGLAGTDAAVERRARGLRRAAYAALALAGGTLALAWTGSYLGNRAFVADAEAGLAAARRELAALGPVPAREGMRLLGVLNALRDLPGGYAERTRGTPFALGLGLYQGEKLGAQALRAYRGALREALMPRLAQALEEDLRSAPAGAGLGRTLSAYAMLYDARGPVSGVLEEEAVRLWRPADGQRADLSGHLRAGSEDRPLEIRHPRNAAIVKEAQERLAAGKP